jgi:hypothetical protein
MLGARSPRKNSGSHIDASLSRQPLVKGERLVRYEVNAVMFNRNLVANNFIRSCHSPVFPCMQCTGQCRQDETGSGYGLGLPFRETQTEGEIKTKTKTMTGSSVHSLRGPLRECGSGCGWGLPYSIQKGREHPTDGKPKPRPVSVGVSFRLPSNAIRRKLKPKPKPLPKPRPGGGRRRNPDRNRNTDQSGFRSGFPSRLMKQKEGKRETPTEGKPRPKGNPDRRETQTEEKPRPKGNPDRRETPTRGKGQRPTQGRAPDVHFNYVFVMFESIMDPPTTKPET